MFESIYSAQVSAQEFFIMAGAALLAGIVFAWVISFKVRATNRFFVVVSLIPFIVASVITFVNGNIGAGIAIGGAFALIRFRSAQGSADEIASILIAMASGIAFGMGYIGYGVAILLCLCALFLFISSLPLFDHKNKAKDRLLKITIPETLEYGSVFDDIFGKYLSFYESVGIKTTGMGSMFRLSYRVRLKDQTQEKAFLDEIRTRNGNLEISLLPYEDGDRQL